jgi:hypothetical protein
MAMHKSRKITIHQCEDVIARGKGMVHTHFFFYLYHLGFIHASVCIFLACGLFKVFCVCLLDI